MASGGEMHRDARDNQMQGRNTEESGEGGRRTGSKSLVEDTALARSQTALGSPAICARNSVMYDFLRTTPSTTLNSKPGPRSGLGLGMGCREGLLVVSS